MKFFKFVNFFKKRKLFFTGILIIPSIYIYSSKEDIFFNHFTKTMKKEIVFNSLHKNLNEKKIFKYNNSENIICEFYPSNINDLEEIFKISKFYNVKLITSEYEDIYSFSDYKYLIIILNLKHLNQFDINFKYNTVSVQANMRVLDLVNELYNKGYIIKGLEFMNHKKDLNLLMKENILFSDLINNRFYNLLPNRKYFIDYIKEFQSITSEGKILNVKTKSNIHNNYYDISSSLLLSGQTLSIITKIILDIEKIQDHTMSDEETKYNNIDLDYLNESFRLVKIPFNNDDNINIFFEKLNKKIQFLKRKKFSNSFNNFTYKYMINNNILLLNLPFKDDIIYLDNCIELCDYISELTENLNTYALFNNPIIGSSSYKYTTQRHLGVNLYSLNEEIKKLFDPYYILNPHVSLKKPYGIKLMKRNSKFKNYLVNKLELDI